jgi:hypothetical protein
MPIKLQQGFDPLAYYGRREDGWRLRSVFAQDGLNPTQVVRFFEAPEGIDFAEGTAQPFRIDATANADDSSNTANVTTDWHRYVVNPHVLKHQFDGLWTGGPCEWGRDQQTQKRTIEQTLTRTWCAGHGYTLDEEGRYVYSAATDSLEYMTAADCLKAHRPALTSRFSPYMALREDIPGSYWREIVWRDFTHESIPFIEALKDSPADVRAIVEYHFGSRVAGDVQDLTTNVDPATNTVYVKCSLLLRDLSEPPPEVDPADPEDVAEWLLTLPVIEAPCTRETLRIFGFDQFANGEGYKFTHVYRWPGLKDSARTRKALEFVCDKYVLPRLRAADYEADDPELDDAELDGTGRFFTTQEQAPASGQTAAVTCRVPWWRIALQKLDEDKGEDGALAFTLVVTKPEWHGRDASGRDVHTSTNNPLGWGLTEHRMYPSLPRDAAQDAMEAISAPTHRLLSGLNQTEGSDGHSDVTWALRDLFEYSGTDNRWKLPPNTQEVKDFRYPIVVFRVSRANASRKDVSVTMPQVDPSKVAAAIEAGEEAFRLQNFTVKKWEARLNAEGDYTLSLSTDGYQGPGAGGAYGATFTESAPVTYSEIEKSYRKPAQAGLSDTPADGYYWRVVTYTAEIGRTSGGATDAAAHCSGGKAGSKIWPERQNDVDSIGSVWAWKKVTAISPGAWQAGVLQQ